MEKLVAVLIAVVAVLVVVLGFLALIAWGVQYAWNGVVPDISSLPPIKFWQAFCLVALVRLLSPFDAGTGSSKKSS